jgi:DNA polymerase elongation subunit (family B)
VSSPKIVIWDIETSHNLIAKFDLREEFTNPANVIQERYIICAAWKELGAKRTYAVSGLDDPKRFKTHPHDDKHVVTTLHGVLSAADAIVAHNGDKFDLRWLQGRMLFHGLPPLPPVKSIDTLKIARKAFFLNSNRLDYLGTYLGLGGKTSTPGGLWLDVLKGSKKAVRTMVEYNKRDVELLEQVFLKIRPFSTTALNYQLFALDNGCPHCGSERFVACGYRYTTTQAYRRFLCRACKRWFSSRKADKVKATEHRPV